MTDAIIEKIHERTSALELTSYVGRLPMFLETESMSPNQLDAIYKVLYHLCKQKNETIIQTLLKINLLPLKKPKTFNGFDFSHVHGKQVDALKTSCVNSRLHQKESGIYRTAGCRENTSGHGIRPGMLHERYENILPQGD